MLLLTRETGDALALLHRVTDRRSSADERNAGLEDQRTGVRANNLGACLTGVSRALNQLAVGDAGAIKSLQVVDGPCRAAGVS